MVKTEVEDLKKNNKELERALSIKSCSSKDKVENANLEHIDKEDIDVFPRIVPKRKRIRNIVISDDENSNANEEDMAGNNVLSWGAKRARSIRVVKARRSDSETSYEDNVPISTLIRRPRIKTDYEDEGDHGLNSTDSLNNGRTSSEYKENNNDLEEISESSDEVKENNDDLEEISEGTDRDEENNDELEEISESSDDDEEDNDDLVEISESNYEDEETNDDLEEGCESSDESMDDSSENDFNHACGGGNSGDESEDQSENVSSKSITPYKNDSSKHREDNDDQEKELEEEDGSLNESIIFISENDSVHANGGGDSGDECDDETDYDINTSINLYKNISSDDEEDNDDSDEDWKAEDDTLGGSIVDGSKNDSQCSYKSNDSGDECEDTSNDLQLNERIPRKRVCNRKWVLEGDMLAAFGKDNNLCLRAVCTLHRQQTEDEKSSKKTRYRNGRGFSQADAPRGSELAEFLLDGDPAGDLKKTVEELKQYDSKGIKDCRKFATTYSKQLFKIYQNNEDPYWPSSPSG